MSLLPFQAHSSFVVSGSTKSGKSTWIRRLLKGGVFTSPKPSRIVYCYGVYDPSYAKLPHGTELHEGIPTKVDVIKWTENEAHLLLVLDDLMSSVIKNDEMEQLFTRGCHHWRMSCIFVTQNLFAQGKSSRTIALNTAYLVLFKNIRDTSQIACLGKQMYPNSVKAFMDAYKDAVSSMYGYFVIDATPSGLEDRRLRTRIFPGEHPIVYQI